MYVPYRSVAEIVGNVVRDVDQFAVQRHDEQKSRQRLYTSSNKQTNKRQTRVLNTSVRYQHVLIVFLKPETKHCEQLYDPTFIFICYRQLGGCCKVPVSGCNLVADFYGILARISL